MTDHQATHDSWPGAAMADRPAAAQRDGLFRAHWRLVSPDDYLTALQEAEQWMEGLGALFVQ